MRGLRKDVPRELQLYWQHQRYGRLPRGGGIEDQEAGLLERMTIIGEAFAACYDFDHIEAGRGADWQRRNPGKWEYVKVIEGLDG